MKNVNNCQSKELSDGMDFESHWLLMTKKILILSAFLSLQFIGYTQLFGDHAVGCYKMDYVVIEEPEPEFHFDLDYENFEIAYFYLYGDSLDDCLKENIVYPQIALDYLIEGMVVVSFIIDKEGAVRDVKVLKSANSYFDNECVRVLENMPNWTPAYFDGHLVSIQFNLPISFKIVSNRGDGCDPRVKN